MTVAARSLAILLTLSLIGGAGSCSTSSPTPDDDVPQTESSTLTDSDLIPVGDSPIYGDPDAPVTIVEFSSMQCPFCARVDDTLEELVERNPDEVRLVFKHFPLPFQQQSSEASKILEATRQQDEAAFWDMKSALFEHIDDFPQRSMEDLGAKLIADFGLDDEEFRRDFNDPELLEVIEEDRELGETIGVQGTPHFRINGQLVSGAKPLEEFQAVVDEQLQVVEELRADGVDEQQLYAASVIHNVDGGGSDDDQAPEESAPRPGAAADDQPTPSADELIGELDVDIDDIVVADSNPQHDSDVLPIDDSPIKGDGDAPVTIVEFVSMQCPFCAQSSETIDELLESRRGDVRVVTKHFPLGMQPEAEPAARAVEAAARQGDAEFWAMQRAMYDHIDHYEDVPMEELGAAIAGELGMDVEQFRTDFNDDAIADAVEADRQLGQELGVRGTPYFLINGAELSGDQPLEDFEQIVDEQLDVAVQLADDGVDSDAIYRAAVEEQLDQQEEPDDEPELREETGEPVDVEYIELGDAPSKGADEGDALVTIVEFASFQCPHCARSADTLDSLVEEYPDQVRVVFKHFPLDMQHHSEPASRAAVAAQNQGRFWEMRDALYDNQNSFRDGLWVELAENIGLDIEEFREDFDAEETADAVRHAQQQGRDAGVRGTPNFFINGINETGAKPLEVFSSHVDDQIAIAEIIREEEGLRGDELHAAVVDYNKENAGGGAIAAPQPEPEADGSDFDPDDLSVGDSFTKGADDPELTIYEFSSFQCPFSTRGADTMKDVMDEYGDRVQLVYKNFPLPLQHESEPAARAAIAAGQQGQFWEMYEALYDHQDRFGDGLWEELAEDIGLDIDQFRQDFESAAVAEQVEAEQAEGRSVGVEGTPTFFVGEEEVRGAQPFSEFERVIEDQL